MPGTWCAVLAALGAALCLAPVALGPAAVHDGAEDGGGQRRPGRALRRGGRMPRDLRPLRHPRPAGDAGLRRPLRQPDRGRRLGQPDLAAGHQAHPRRHPPGAWPHERRLNLLPSTLTPKCSNLRQVKKAGDFEGVVSYGLGLSRRTGFRVFRLPVRRASSSTSRTDRAGADDPTDGYLRAGSPGPPRGNSAASLALRSAYCRIEEGGGGGRSACRSSWRRRCPARSPCAPRGPYTTPCAGAADRTSVFPPLDGVGPTFDARGSTRVLRKTLTSRRKAHAIEDDDARPEPPAASLPPRCCS